MAASGAAAAVCSARGRPQDMAGVEKVERLMHCAVGSECWRASPLRSGGRMVPRSTDTSRGSRRSRALRLAWSMRGLGDHAASAADQKHETPRHWAAQIQRPRTPLLRRFQSQGQLTVWLSARSALRRRAGAKKRAVTRPLPEREASSHIGKIFNRSSLGDSELFCAYRPRTFKTSSVTRSSTCRCHWQCQQQPMPEPCGAAARRMHAAPSANYAPCEPRRRGVCSDAQAAYAVTLASLPRFPTPLPTSATPQSIR